MLMEISDLRTFEPREPGSLRPSHPHGGGEARSLGSGPFRRLRQEMKEHVQAEAAVFCEALLQSGEDRRDPIHDGIARVAGLESDYEM